MAAGRLTERDGKGDLVADPKKFPSGMKALADYVHAHGMKFGLHQPAGIKDCGHDEPGSQNNEERDAKFIRLRGGWITSSTTNAITSMTPKMTPGTPDLDKLVVRKGEQIVFVTEAEAPQNHIYRPGAHRGSPAAVRAENASPGSAMPAERWRCRMPW